MLLASFAIYNVFGTYPIKPKPTHVKRCIYVFLRMVIRSATVQQRPEARGQVDVGSSFGVAEGDPHSLRVAVHEQGDTSQSDPRPSTLSHGVDV
jgi:hypothetical protein